MYLFIKNVIYDKNMNDQMLTKAGLKKVEEKL